jgi:hypothetical protein
MGDISTGPPALSLLLRRPDDPESVRIKALLLAYGSAAVQRAYDESEQMAVKVAQAAYAVEQANTLEMRAQAIRETGKDPEQVMELPSYGEALERLHALKDEAFQVDQRLFDAINSELAWKPAEPGIRATGPAKD